MVVNLNKLVRLITLTVWLLALSSLSGAQDVSGLSPRALRTADLLGVRTQMEELQQLRAAEQRDELREMRLVQRLQGSIVATALDVDSVNARIDFEIARLNEVQGYLSARRDRRVNLLNVGNLVIGTGVGAVGSGLQFISSAQHAGNIVSTSAGVGGTLLSVFGLREQKGTMRAPGYTPAMLAKLLGDPVPAGSDYPQEIWAFLTTPDPSLPRGSTGQQHLMTEWVTFGHLKQTPDQQDLAMLTSTGKGGAPIRIDAIGDRTAMLADVQAHVSTLLVDLAELMRFVIK